MKRVKRIKVLALALALGLTGYVYAAGNAQIEDQSKTTKAKVCCTDGAACSKEDGNCCKADKECCKEGASCCASKDGCCLAGKEAGRNTADGKCCAPKPESKVACCGTSCPMAKAARK